MSNSKELAKPLTEAEKSLWQSSGVLEGQKQKTNSVVFSNSPLVTIEDEQGELKKVTNENYGKFIVTTNGSLLIYR